MKCNQCGQLTMEVNLCQNCQIEKENYIKPCINKIDKEMFQTMLELIGQKITSVAILCIEQKEEYHEYVIFLENGKHYTFYPHTNTENKNTTKIRKN